MPTFLGRALAAFILLATALAAPAASAADTDQPAGRLVSDVAAPNTPHVLDGRVYSVVQVGNTIVLGGTFTRVRNDNETTELVRNGLVAFDATTGRISTTFAPNPNGIVRVVLPSGDGSTVYVGGSFTTIAGVARQRVARIRVSDGALVTAFNAGGVSGEVKDLSLRAGRLWLGGAFTHVGGVSHPALATVNPTTGAVTSYMSLLIAGVHNGGATQVLKMDLTPDGSRLVAIGNFDTLAGVTNHQLLVLDLTGPSAAPSTFRTSFYTSACSGSFNSYMRDVDISPDGTWFAVGTTGAYGGSEGACDSVARFELGAVGSNVPPSWVDYTGGDTTYTVEITPGVLYVGGHQRWWNNPFAGDRAGQGAISREGIAALDPVNGLPLTWNPGRAKGVGVFDFLSTSQGLWVASDTDRIGDFQLKSRIARFNPQGVTFPAVVTPTLPSDVFIGGPVGTAVLAPGLRRRSFTGTTTGPTSTAPTGGIDWSATRGAFMINGNLYLAAADGTLSRRSFDGTTYGAPTAVAASDQIVPLTDWQNDIRSATGMFFDRGRIYFTLVGSTQLYYRYFSPQSDVVGAKRLVASGSVAGVEFANVSGMFVTPTHLYWATLDGTLRRIGWTQAGPSGVPVAGTASVVSGPGVDGADWAAHDLFVYQGSSGAGATVTAAFGQSCAGTTCAFDASASTANGSTISSYDWTFGDSTTGTGVSPSHTYGAAGSYNVSLTVTTASGATSTTSHPVAVTASTAQLAHVASTSTGASSTTQRVVIPATVAAGDRLLLHLTVNDSTVSIGGPVGWTPVDSIDGTGVLGRSWTRVASASDPGSNVVVTTSTVAKGVLAVSAYRSSTGSSIVADGAAAIDATSGTSHVSPQVNMPAGGGWVVTVWTAKSSVDTVLTPPGSLVTRTAVGGTGSGRLTSVVVDSGATVPGGPVAGTAATTDVAVSRTVMFATAISPG